MFSLCKIFSPVHSFTHEAQGQARRSWAALYFVSASSDHLIDISLSDSSMIFVGSGIVGVSL